ncbi:unnamed protein product [Cochlearia groenlandica]
MIDGVSERGPASDPVGDEVPKLRALAKFIAELGLSVCRDSEGSFPRLEVSAVFFPVAALVLDLHPCIGESIPNFLSVSVSGKRDGTNVISISASYSSRAVGSFFGSRTRGESLVLGGNVNRGIGVSSSSGSDSSTYSYSSSSTTAG